MASRLKVAHVAEGSKAFDLGIEPNDYIVKAYNASISSYSDLTKALALAEYDQVEKYSIVVKRNNNELVFETTLGNLGLEFSEVSKNQIKIDGSTAVSICDISIPFSSLVIFFIKCMFASIPATLIAFVLVFIAGRIFSLGGLI